MPDTNQNTTAVDLDTLTDDEVRNLGDDQIQLLMEQEEQEYVETSEVEQDEEESNDSDDPESTTDESSDEEEANDAESPTDGEPESEEDGEVSEPDPENTPDTEGENSEENTSEPEGSNEEKPEDTPKEEEESNKDKEPVKPKDKSESKPNDAVSSEVQAFYDKVTAPFKADGKDFTVKSADDLVRLAQMGVNYSRNMKEIKPVKALNEMLKQHGLDNPQAISYLIDLNNGDKDAIKKLLADKNIDPLDINVTEENTYKATDHSVPAKVMDFQQAIADTQAAPGGQDLINDINKTWDNESMEALKEKPDIFQNLLAQKDSGEYEQIIRELDYQHTMGFLKNVPFLQGYINVDNAMKKAGAFSKPKTQSTEVGELQSDVIKPTPIDTGTRKAARQKTKQPNPNLSSKPPHSASNNNAEVIVDYETLSDEEMNKLSAPPNH